MKKITNHTIYNLYSWYFRSRRMKRFMSTFKLNETIRILDVGGNPLIWKYIDNNPQISFLNLTIPDNTESLPSNYSFIQGDGTKLDFSDNSFDIAFSNSVIEHLHTYPKQKIFAEQIRRVAPNIWVQTPAKSFFIEPHLITPFIHYLPKRYQRSLLRNFTLWGLLTRPSTNEVKEFLNEVRLLSYREMRQLFPDCVIMKEKFLFITKSYIAVRKYTGD